MRHDDVTDLEDFGIDLLLFFVEETHHLNGQVRRKSADPLLRNASKTEALVARKTVLDTTD